MLEETYYIIRVKKPHKKFAVGDIVIGVRVDGQSERMVCSGWSSKLNVFIHWYSMRYQGWNDWNNYSTHRITGKGHLTIIEKFDGESELLHEFSVCKSYADFMRQLSLFGGNVPGLVEAAATHH